MLVVSNYQRIVRGQPIPYLLLLLLTVLVECYALVFRQPYKICRYSLDLSVLIYLVVVLLVVAAESATRRNQPSEMIPLVPMIPVIIVVT